MSLPPSGPLSFNDIASELGIGTTPLSLRSMSALAGFSTPDAVSEFYGYSSVLYCGPSEISVFEQGVYIGQETLPAFGSSVSFNVYQTQRVIQLTGGTNLTPTFILEGSTTFSYYTYKQVKVIQGLSTLYDSGNYLTDDNGPVGNTVTLTPTITLSSLSDVTVVMFTKIYAL